MDSSASAATLGRGDNFPCNCERTGVIYHYGEKSFAVHFVVCEMRSHMADAGRGASKEMPSVLHAVEGTALASRQPSVAGEESGAGGKREMTSETKMKAHGKNRTEAKWQ